VIHTLDETLEYLRKRQLKDSTFTYELIVVDDGSKDRTTQVVIDYVEKNKLHDVVYVLRYEKNKGKGFAVKQGVLHSRGKRILMADSDAATEISDLEALEKVLLQIEKNGYGIAVGSRAHMEKGVIRERKWYRNILMYGWHFLVKYIAGISDIDDTQCGFKLFTRQTAKDIFLNLRIDGWSFDIDLFMISQRLKIPAQEVAVNWREIEGSKMNMKGMIKMGIDLLLLRLYYILGLWKLNPTPSLSQHN
jgi:dolichyl-phosphate beta-glucosyltransferase